MSQHETSALPVLPDELSITETARLLRLPRHSVLLAVLTRSLPHVRRGRQLLVPTRPLLGCFGVPCTTRGDHHDR